MTDLPPVLSDPWLDDQAQDDALAQAARTRYRADGLASIEPDDGLRSVLHDGEQLLALCDSASVHRVPTDGSDRRNGRLAVTTDRLLILDPTPVTIATLDELDDVSLVGERLLAILTNVSGFFIETRQPRLLRVQLAAARAGRLERQSKASSDDGSGSPVDLPRR